MTFKLFLTALLSSLATALAVYAMEPAEATEATQATARSREWSAVSPVTVWPPPQEPVLDPTTSQASPGQNLDGGHRNEVRSS